jgi:hypothetical protein
MSYIPLKPKREEELEKLKEEIKILYEKIERLEAENRELKQKLLASETHLTPQEAQKEIEALIEKAKNMVRLEKTWGGDYYCTGVTKTRGPFFIPDYDRHLMKLHGCSITAYVEGNKIVYGVLCNHPDSKGFYKQGEIPIPKYLRDFL